MKTRGLASPADATSAAAASEPHKGARRRGEESAVGAAVRRLREEILAVEAGTRLGTEEDILLRFSLSRPTLRQAARILEHEQLLEVRRGGAGGLYGRRPSIDSVTEAISLFLYKQSATFSNVTSVTSLLSVEATRLAALSNDLPGKARLREIFDELGATPAENTSEFLRGERQIFDQILSLTGNPVLELLERALYDFSLYYTDSRVFQDRPDRRSLWRQTRLQAVEAILGGDVEVATLFAQRLACLISAWVTEDEADV